MQPAFFLFYFSHHFRTVFFLFSFLLTHFLPTPTPPPQIKDKMDLALGVALGSCLQIAIFVLPACVLAGWAMGSVDAAGDPFALDLDPFLVLTLTLSVVLAYFVTADGRSNWLLGLELVVAYCLIGLVFLVKKEPGGGGGGGKAPAAALLL